MAQCYKLTGCTPATSPNIIITYVNLATHVGFVIGISEHPGNCYTVTDNGSACPGAITVTFVQQYGDCIECQGIATNPCACPPGTIAVTLPDGTEVCRQDIVVPAQGPNCPPSACQKLAGGIATNPQGGGVFGRSSDYGSLGTNFYPDTSLMPWPITFKTGPCVLGAHQVGSQGYNTFVGAPIPLIANVTNPVWGDGNVVFNGRFNIAGVNMSKNNPCLGNPFTGSYGFTFCLNVTTLTNYSFGFGGRNVQIVINGAVFIYTNPLNNDNWQYKAWSVIELKLPPGNYIIQMSALTTGGTDSCGEFTFSTTYPGTEPGMAFEIYNASIATLQGMTTAQVNATLVYTTLNEVGQKMDYGENAYNYRCPCGIIYTPDLCAQVPNTAFLPCPTPNPSPTNNYNVVVPILDNCTNNVLNPNADPNIYVCHGISDIPKQNCCYLLTNCDPLATPAFYITNTNLSAYLNPPGQVVTITDPTTGLPIPGCFTVALGNCGPTIPPAVTVTASFLDCASCLPKCYLLTDCEGLLPNILTNTNLSVYVGSTVKLCPPATITRNTRQIDNTQDASCCTILTDCCDPNNKIKVNCPTSPGTGPAPNYFGLIINIPSLGATCWKMDLVGDLCSRFDSTIPTVSINWIVEYPGIVTHTQCSDCTSCKCGCFIVTEAGGCVGAVPLSGTITAQFVDCEACLPKCYRLINCVNPLEIKVTDTDLSLYIGQVIFIDGCPGICWLVERSPNCNGAVPIIFIKSFIDCPTCLNIPPPPPLELHPRRIKPGYSTPGCPPAYTELVNCSLAEAAYDEMVIKRYGITMCCNLPIQKWDIKKQLLDLKALFDPDLCKNTFDTCCPPCAMVAEIVIYNPMQCLAPTNITAQFGIPASLCPAPIRMQAGISLPSRGCSKAFCYRIDVTTGPCQVEYTDCNNTLSSIYVTSSVQVCSLTLPTSVCPGVVVSTGTGNCSLGTFI